MMVVFDIDGVIRDVGGSYRRALADTVEAFTGGDYRPSPREIDDLKAEGLWNNDWEASQELVYRYFAAQGQPRDTLKLDYRAMITFFQAKYWGADPQHGQGYICQEPLLIERVYLESLTAAEVRWGFFSGATRASASYVLERRLGLIKPILVAMEDAPGKPDPTGLFAAIALLGEDAAARSPMIYVGDTVADMAAVDRARQVQGDRTWVAVGVLPPHVLGGGEQQTYAATLRAAGAQIVLENVQELTPKIIASLEHSSPHPH